MVNAVKAMLVCTDGMENTDPFIAAVSGTITANTFAIAINFQRALLWIGEVITKGDVIMHPIADCLHPGPARKRRTKKPPRFII